MPELQQCRNCNNAGAIQLGGEKRAPEPYKGKGIKYADEVIRRKVGKTGKK